jgi:hypothetical protein
MIKLIIFVEISCKFGDESASFNAAFDAAFDAAK